MSGLLIGYARVSTEEQDLTAQRNGLTELGVDLERIYVDHGLTGTNRDRPGLREALAACRAGDTLVVAKLELLGSGEYTTAEVGDLFGVARSTVYRAVERSKRAKTSARRCVGGARTSLATTAKTAESAARPRASIETQVAEVAAITYPAAPRLQRRVATAAENSGSDPPSQGPDAGTLSRNHRRRDAGLTSAGYAPGDGSPCGRPLVRVRPRGRTAIVVDDAVYSD